VRIVTRAVFRRDETLLAVDQEVGEGLGWGRLFTRIVYLSDSVGL
jgi:hypothetical protein